MSYRISVRASDDIENIWFYTYKNWSRKQADRYLNLIFNEIKYLSENPETGKDFRKIRKDYRCSKVKSHLILFKYSKQQNDIEIIRVLHQRIYLENRLEE